MTIKKNYLFLLLVMFLFIVIAGYLFVDSPTSQTVIGLDNRFEQYRKNATQPQIDSYYYQMGMGYQTKSLSIIDTMAIGKDIVGKIDTIEKNDTLTYDEKRKKSNQVLANYKAIQTKNSFCSIIADSQINDCIDVTKSSPEQWQQTVIDGQNTRIHYQHYLMLEPSVTLLGISPYAPTPNWSLLSEGQRVTNVEYLLLAKAGQPQIAMDNLIADFAKLRQHFANSDTLLKKMVLQKMLLEQLQMMANTKTQYDKDNKLPTSSITPLSPLETSLELPLIFEYQYSKYIFLLATDSHEINLSKNILIKFFFKKQKSINAIAQYYYQQLNKDKINANDLAIQMNECDDTNKEDNDINVSNIDNLLGNLLINIANVDYAQYRQKLISTNNMINMVNHILTNGKPSLSNVYAPTLSDVNISDEHICMPHPKSCSIQTNFDEQAKQDSQDCVMIKPS